MNSQKESTSESRETTEIKHSLVLIGGEFDRETTFEFAGDTMVRMVSRKYSGKVAVYKRTRDFLNDFRIYHFDKYIDFEDLVTKKGDYLKPKEKI